MSGATKDQIRAFLNTAFPQHCLKIDRVGEREAVVRKSVEATNLRPGNTVAGPFMMGLADEAMYVAILAEIGIVPLAVTTSLTINFLSRPRADVDMVATCRLIKVGQKLVVGEVTLNCDGEVEPVAHVVATYAIPPKS